MNRKPPELPDIEDATLRACLAPLMEAMNAGSEFISYPVPALAAAVLPPEHLPGPSVSNDNPEPVAPVGAVDAPAVMPQSRQRGSSDTQDEHGMFRTIDLFLAMSDEELATAAAGFPRQIAGTMARLERMKQRLVQQCDHIAIVTALLERAMAKAAAMDERASE